MTTIRARAVELSAQPNILERAPTYFEDPGRAKLEADAYLALAIGNITTKLVGADDHRERFLNRFHIDVTDYYGFVKNTELDRGIVNTFFNTMLMGIYGNSPILSETINDTDIGRRTQQACLNYVRSCDRVGLRSDAEIEKSKQGFTYLMYEEPMIPISTGLKDTFIEGACRIVSLASDIPKSVDERPDILRRSVRGLQKKASLSLHQARQVDDNVVIREHSIDVAPNISVIRELDEYKDEVDAKIRPKRGCPALPVLPESFVSHSGSSIGELWNMVIDLAVASNMHALDVDDERYQIADYKYGTKKL